MTNRAQQILSVSLLLTLPLSANASDRLTDLAARIDFGFYANEGRVIDAAANALAQLNGSDPFYDYYRGYASLRSAQLLQLQGRSYDKAIGECIEFGESTVESSSLAAEGWVLIAACSAVASAGQSPLFGSYQRRAVQALNRARGLEPENPRLRLIEALTWKPDRTQDSAESAEAKLESALSAFRSLSNPFALPNWGEAEVLASLGAHYLESGDTRAARDYIEQALLVAPDYHYALRLRRRLRGE